jgi:hypothetical protein
MLKVLQFKPPKTVADETLVSALSALVEQARNGEIDRLVCVGVGSGERFYRVTYHSADLALLGALSLVIDQLQSSCWKSD